MRSRTHCSILPSSGDCRCLGVCRGMQVIQHRFGIPLCRVEGHVAPRQTIRIDGESREVNSYHHFGAFESRPPLERLGCCR